MREHLVSGFGQWLHWFGQTAMLVGIPVVLLLLVLAGKLFYRTVACQIADRCGAVAANDLGTIFESAETREERINDLANRLKGLE